jgi:hypothetical protein
MSHVEITSRVGPDGILRLAVPFGLSEANREVKVVVEPADSGTTNRPADQDWREFVKSMAGCISDPTFQRPDQGQYEQRNEAFP